MHVCLDVFSKDYGGCIGESKYSFINRATKEAALRQLKLRFGEDYTFNDFFGTQVAFYLMFQMLLVAKPELVKKEPKKASETISVRKNGHTTYKSVVYVKNYYTVSEKKLTKSDLHHIIKCPAWGVRGHKRHLSNGSIIFVKPYIKGKFRNDGTKYVAKTYKTD